MVLRHETPSKLCAINVLHNVIQFYCHMPSLVLLLIVVFFVSEGCRCPAREDTEFGFLHGEDWMPELEIPGVLRQSFVACVGLMHYVHLRSLGSENNGTKMTDCL